jgi:hypothetical protein
MLANLERASFRPAFGILEVKDQIDSADLRRVVAAAATAGRR